MSSLRRALVATVAVLAATTLLAGCGANSKSNTDFAPVSDVEYNPVNGISLDSTVVKVRNLYALAALGAVSPRLRMTLVNTTLADDALVGATLGTPATAGRLIGGQLGALPVPRGTSVLVGSDLGPQITFPNAQVKAGTWQPVILLFRSGRAVAGSVLVQSPVSEYSDGTLPQGRVPAEPVSPTQPVEPLTGETTAP